MVPGLRNPMWGEEFNFAVEELPVEVVIFMIHTILIVMDPKHSCGTILRKLVS